MHVQLLSGKYGSWVDGMLHMDVRIVLFTKCFAWQYQQSNHSKTVGCNTQSEALSTSIVYLMMKYESYPTKPSMSKLLSSAEVSKFYDAAYSATQEDCLIVDVRVCLHIHHIQGYLPDCGTLWHVIGTLASSHCWSKFSGAILVTNELLPVILNGCHRKSRRFLVI